MVLAKIIHAARSWSNLRKFREDYRRFSSLSRADRRMPVEWENRYPCFNDDTAQTYFDRHYIYHTAWAARMVSSFRPLFHVDISSSLYFSTIVSAFVPVEYYDLRRADLSLSGFSSHDATLLSLPFEDASVESLSCMHVLEHVGLGRYGDPLDPDGDLKAIQELKRVLAPGGNLLFVVPIGKPRVMFNAHRIYSYEQITSYFSELDLRAFALIPDASCDGGLVEEATQELADSQEYGCGCFWFTRRNHE
jgi:SAM-dependent methyltransferase